VTVTAPLGFVAAGVACGIKSSGAPDLALVATADGRPVPTAAVFTANRATAAPVQVSRRHLAASGGNATAVVLNSGNANAATGAPGVEVAEGTCALVAAGLGCAAAEVLVCSTGLIGIPLALAPFVTGVPTLVAARGPAGGAAAAAAILTTDTGPKEIVIRGNGFTVGGMAKGAAMLAPHMATMLAVLTTDAAVAPVVLQHALAAAVTTSFNEITVDGSNSTNDTVIVLAGGGRGPVDEDAFADALARACSDLAGQMAADAEGATKLIRVEVTGAASDADAARAARQVAESQLVKCSFYGQDPYWGRVVSELGSAGAAFELGRVSVAYGGVVVCRRGEPAAHDAVAVAAHLAGRRVTVSADLGLGPGRAAVTTADLTPAYIAENMRTS